MATFSLPLVLNPRPLVDVGQQKFYYPIVSWGDAHMLPSSSEKEIEVKIVNSHFINQA